MPAIRRVLIANRGEIAVRVIRTCRRLGIETVLAVCDTDADAVPARMAGQTIRIGPGGLAETYLSVEAVTAAAVAAGADAIHPGYGFLAENPQLARACETAGIVFIGPGSMTHCGCSCWYAVTSASIQPRGRSRGSRSAAHWRG